MGSSAGATTGAKTAAMVIIGDEILSGRTQDKNLKTLAEFLAPLGIELREVRVVADVESAIVEAVNALRGHWDYVFTTGGIGPTHDDITADSIAKAFGVGIDIREDAAAILHDHYGDQITEARLRMARIPDGARLIKNPSSAAPGFQMDNVFVMAGVPGVFQSMLVDVEQRLEVGAVRHMDTVRGVGVLESVIAKDLRDLAEANPELQIGSYPFFDPKGNGTAVVVKGYDPGRVLVVIEQVRMIMNDIQQNS